MVEKYATVLDDVCDPLTVSKFSQKSSISRQKAITVLEEYVKAKGAPVWALYEISGTVDSAQFSFLPANEKMVKHVVVPESDLEAAKKQFEEVFSTCMHSIQRTNPKETRVYGRLWANNDDLAGVKVPQQENQKKKVESPVKKVEKVEVKKEKSASPEPSTSSKPSEPVKKEKKTIIQPKKPQSVMSMFAKKAEKTEKSKSPSASPPPQEQEKKTRKRPKVEIDEPEPVVKKEKTPEKKKSLFDADDDDMPSSREQTPEKEPAPKKRKSVANDENRKGKKARKLIVPESDEEEEKKMEVDEVKEEEKPKLKVVKTEDRRRTTRMEKVVETFVDEDGYLVSKEVTKAVECSPQQSPEKAKPKVITSAVPGTSKAPKKNATITSFFKKK